MSNHMFKQAYSNLILQLAEMPTFIQHSTSGISADLLVRRPDHDNSPLIEHLWHLRDCDSDLYAHRIRQVLQENQPFIEPVDVGSWSEQRGYLGRNAELAIAEFAAGRSALVAELHQLDEDELSRIGHRADGSSINVLGLIEQLAEHDRDHRWRIAAILRDYSVNAARLASTEIAPV